MVAFTVSTLVTSKNSVAFVILASKEEKGRDFMPEPLLAKEKISVWVKHVLILFSLSDKILAFLGQFPSFKSHPGKVKCFFPCYPITMPYASEERALDLNFMETPMRVFRSAHPPQNKDYLAWLDKVQSKRKEQ